MSASQDPAGTLTLPPTCGTCQYCDNCDTKTGYSRNILRFCEHGEGRAYIELRDVTASGHDCPATAPLRRNASSRQQASSPNAPQSGQVPMNYVPEHEAQQARQEYLLDGYRALGNARAHVGDNYTGVPLVEGRRTHRNIVVDGSSRSHIGNNYNDYQERRTPSNQATNGQNRSNPPQEDRLEGDDFPFGDRH